MNVLDLSLGGCLLSGRSSLDVDLVRDVRFVCNDDGWSVVLRLKIVHRVCRNGGGSTPIDYVFGCAFIDPEDLRVMHSVDGLIARATGILAFPDVASSLT